MQSKTISKESPNILLLDSSISDNEFKNINNNFEKRVNPETVVWQKPETKYWINYLKNLIQDHCKETNSNLAQKIIDNFNKEIYNFIQVCPKEMINKLENPITDKMNIKKVG